MEVSGAVKVGAVVAVELEGEGRLRHGEWGGAGPGDGESREAHGA